MSIIGRVASLWRYPVKSMRGESLREAFLGFAGIHGDRVFAIRSSIAPKGFPYLTAREQRKLLACSPRFRHPEKAAQPANLAEAENLAPGVGLTPAPTDATDFMVDVELPTGRRLAIDDPALLHAIRDGLPGAPELTLMRSDRAITDCRPVSLLSLQTARQLGDEIGATVDARRFRANIYLDLNAPGGFAEDGYIGRSLRIGSRAVVSLLQRDARCAMITLDPETGESNPAVLKRVAQAHQGMAGVYAAVLVEGIVRAGDAVEVLSQ
ncbi:MAG: MOSC domain-containing protein [Verrucomicrobia bacterium]|nr:MOSC domain-containing protein [Verrucomicrobiota bacterium]